MDEKRLVKYSYDWLAPVILVDMLNPSETERVNPRTETWEGEKDNLQRPIERRKPNKDKFQREFVYMASCWKLDGRNLLKKMELF
jgi:hypothetical protein